MISQSVLLFSLVLEILLWNCISHGYTSPLITSKCFKWQHFRASANDYDDEDDDDDFIDDSKLDTSQFTYKDIAFGPGRGRSAPSQRKAMGKSGTSSASVHVCTNCSAEYVKWVGKCSTCNEWNTVQEFKVNRSPASSQKSKGRAVFGSTNDFSTIPRKSSSWLPESNEFEFYNDDNGYQAISLTDMYKEMGRDGTGELGSSFNENRILIPNDDELNQVLGGGIMPGSLILLGGEPGVGKSTLLLQMAGAVASLSTPPRPIGMGIDDESVKHLGPVLYVSGEENQMQIASRAMRLGIDESELLILCETDADYVAGTVAAYCNDAQLPQYTNDYKSEGEHYEKSKSLPLGKRRQPSLLVIDSIQTMICDNGGASSAGGVTQVRECVALYLRLAKATGIPIILIGHVTKSGNVAGPRTVEHMVDAVLYLEGGSQVGGGPSLRMLRAAKNRFGSNEEVGVYSTTQQSGGRLIPVSDPSSLFLSNRMDSEDIEGCAVSIILEGIRPMAIEVQALVTNVFGGSFSGRRTVDGISTPRLLLILAVLQKRCGVSFARQDVYINVVGGMNLSKNKEDGSSSDLAVAMSLVSSAYNIPIRSDTAFIGEIGLLGELRPVSSTEKRIQEARRMGFSTIIVPKIKSSGKRGKYIKSLQSTVRGIDIIEVDNLRLALEKGLTSKIPKKKPRKERRLREHSASYEDLGLDDDDDDEFIIDDEDSDDNEAFG
jgi:DNA repair protein RadA/Sms